MSFSHAQGLRDALHRLRDTYLPPTAEEVQLFTQTLTTDEPVGLEPELIRLHPQMPVPMPELHPKPKRPQPKPVAPVVKPVLLAKYYPPEEVETRW